MIRGLYTAAAGMIAQQRVHDTATTNIANLNTTGYKASHALNRSFPEMLLSMSGKNDEPVRRIGRLSTGVLAEESIALQVQGDLNKTDKPSDFAILSEIQVPGVTFDASGKSVAEDGTVTYRPQAYFTVLNEQEQTRYTRGGEFHLTGEGALVTSDGSPVLGAGGQPIAFEPGTSLDSLKLDGSFRFVDATGAPTGQALLITQVDRVADLVREGDGKLRLDGEGGAAPAQPGAGIEVRQGYAERSNVDPTQTMLDLMGAMRAYEANQKVIQFYDKSLEKAANEIGRV
ncbi:flagellar hook-basal body protein [Paenibacillus sp. FSL W8-1187]|uniref:Flagellar basal-body rod protein FlgF n=1 Tax=Paenibacillus pasadenensis TaxID=217090 RepID=A0A2N5NDH0_9BACL|nr:MULTISPECIES: flagellar hook-basal body protein [Paenibacillus]PLT48397.1 Flagellar basal-body rod protein FlgF [Paenibacillus pasadenensis]QGG58127.1 flagellar hook-basal body protein [Paenibacillus sp. B01]